VPSGLPIENYAPDVEVINGRMYFTAAKEHFPAAPLVLFGLQ
jgi:hypothetical protein